MLLRDLLKNWHPANTLFKYIVNWIPISLLILVLLFFTRYITLLLKSNLSVIDFIFSLLSFLSPILFYKFAIKYSKCIYSLFALFILFFSLKNTDGQGSSDLLETVTLKNPFNAFVEKRIEDEIRLIEEDCYNDLQDSYRVNALNELVNFDLDNDSFHKECGDVQDGNPSYAPRSLKHKYKLENFEPNLHTTDVKLKPGYRFYAQVNSLPSKAIKDVFLVITSDALDKNEGIYTQYNQDCKAGYDNNKKYMLYCDLDDRINSWFSYVNKINTEGIYKWKFKFTTTDGKTGFLPEPTVWSNSKWSYFKSNL